MPAKSEAQRRAAGAALAAKRGQGRHLRGPSRQMAESMSEAELKKMARKPRRRKSK